MTKEELKTLSDQTFYDNNNGEIQPAAHRNFNNNLINSLPAMPPDKSAYTYIVDSNETLQAWADNAAGNDYTAVLVKKGSYSISKAIYLSASGTKVVAGMTGSEIIITASRAFTYSSVIPPEEYSNYLFAGLKVTLNTTGSAPQALMNIPVMYNCVIDVITVVSSKTTGVSGSSRMINCTVSVTRNGTAGTVIGLTNCSDVFGCTVSVTGGTVMCYQNCERLSNCSGRASGTAKGTVFSECHSLSDCTATDELGKTDIMYDKCTALANCIALPQKKTDNTTIAFSECKYLTNCKADTSVYGASGNSLYFGCMFLTACSAHCNIVTSSTGFKECYNMFGCSVYTYNFVGTGSSVGCFHTCRILYGCIATTIEQQYAYRYCYMVTIGASDAVNETVSGGCNSFVPSH